MKLVGRDRLDDFCGRHTDARKWIENWLAEVGSGTWKTPPDIKSRYVAASFLPGNVVIFNVKGDEYRLEVSVAYRTETVIVNWIGGHAEYDQRNKRR